MERKSLIGGGRFFFGRSEASAALRPSIFLRLGLLLLVLLGASPLQANNVGGMSGTLPGRLGGGFPDLIRGAGTFSCAIRGGEGTIACWGSGSAQTTAPTGNFIQLGVGTSDTSCAVAANGDLACWGANASITGSVPSGKYLQVAVGGSHACALASDGTLDCWGTNSGGSTAPPTGIYRQVSAGPQHSCGIRDDQTLRCWGVNAGGNLAPPTGNFLQVGSGTDHACALRTNGAIACWGDNSSGQLTSIPTGTYLQLVVGGDHACALRADGEAACWGSNANGEVSGTPAGPFLMLGAGVGHNCALRIAGGLACWGNNGSGQATPPATTDFGHRVVTAARRSTCEIRPDGQLGCWKNEDDFEPAPPAGRYWQVAGGSDAFCALSVSGSTPTCWGVPARLASIYTGTPGTPPSGVLRQVSVGLEGYCQLSANGTVSCESVSPSTVTAPSGSGFAALGTSLAAYPFCFLQNDGDVTCSGNEYGNASFPDPPSGRFRQLGSSRDYSCGLRVDGTLVCWGLSFPPASPFPPVDNVPTGRYRSLSVGSAINCAIRDDGEIVCWGYGSQVLSTIPSGAFVSVGVGSNHACAVRTDDAMLSWGLTSGAIQQAALDPGLLPTGANEGVAYGPVQLSLVAAIFMDYVATPAVYSVVSGALPAGLSLSAAGVLSGTPT